MKKIQINPAFLNLTKKKKEKRKKKEKPTTFKANKIKKAFLEKIKKHQEDKKYGEKFKDTLKFENEFEKALGYLGKLKTENEQKKEKKTQQKQKNDLIKDDPPWGVLKNGKKPLYRQYHNTLKKKMVENKNLPERKVKLEELKCRIRHTSSTPKTLRKYIKRRLGKQQNRKINIMVNSKTIRRETEKKCRTLKNKKLSTMKTELRRKGLLRVGSTAPQNIIREIYVAANLAGEVTNKGGGVILHNYLKKDDLKKELKII